MSYTVTDLVRNGTSRFVHYRDGQFRYEVDGTGFEYDIPLDDIGSATLLSQEKAIVHMRWIRKRVELLKENEG